MLGLAISTSGERVARVCRPCLPGGPGLRSGGLFTACTALTKDTSSMVSRASAGGLLRGTTLRFCVWDVYARESKR